MPEEAVLPDAAEIRRDMEYMTARWHELDQPCVFEIRAFKEGTSPKSAKFAPDWIDDAVEWAVSMNDMGYNIYSVRNPIRQECSASAKDEDIVAAFFLWADCDDPDSAGNIKRFDGPKYSAAVVTGRTPSTRVHVYWQLEQPCRDMAEWREMQVNIAAHFGSDRAVINPSRIMRVAGTVAYPFEKKRQRGYVKELTTIRTEYEDARAPVSMDQMRRVFGAGKSQGSLSIDTGPQPLDRERVRIQALSGQEWHHSVVRLVASYVSRGLSDDEIHGLTDPLTLPGFTVEQTRAEVQTAINGARAKGWTPQEYAAPEPDWGEEAAKSPTTPPSVEWFDDIEAALTDSYMVKGVVARESMSVVYGPSNSGKTFFALDLAYHIAIGADWRGRRVSQAAVLYLAAEGGRGVANRIVALKQAHGVCDVPFALKRAGMDLLHDQADLDAIYTLAQSVKAAKDNLPLLIVIDTLSRVMAGGDENSAADMTALIRNIDAIRAATGAHVMLVHHTGKDTARGARGHSSLRAATDTEIEVQAGEDDDGAQQRAAMVTKQRDYQGGETFAFALRSVTLGVDQDGDEVTSCVVVEADAEEFRAAKKAKKGLGGNQLLIAETFDQMLSDGLGKPNPGGTGFPDPGQFWCVPLDRLRDLVRGKMTASDTRSAFNQAMRALREDRKLFCVAGEMAWRVDRKVKQ